MNFRRRRDGKNSPFVSVLFGLGLFLGSFVMLYFNEGRVDLSKIAQDSIPVSAETVDSENQGELVAVSGVLQSDEQLGDPKLLATSGYLQLERDAEMYAWEESSSEDEDGNRSYDYDRRWTSDPEDSSRFERPQGHFNPPMKYEPAMFTVSAARIGAFRLDPAALFFMEKEELPLREGMLLQGQLRDNYIFIGDGELDDPEIGDLRIAYYAFHNGQEGTVFGEQYEGGVRPYVHRDDTILYRAYPSEREGAIDSMHSEYLTLLWGFRAGGLVMMWMGLLLFVSPLTNLLGYVPIVGNAGRAVITFLALAVAVVLSLITIVISAILHNPFALVTILLLVLVGAVLLIRRGKRS